MFGFHYIKTTTAQYVFHYQNGKLRHAGAGVAFYYYRPRSIITFVPLTSADVPFMFDVSTLDFQTVTVQGQLSYRISDPETTARFFDFSINPENETYKTEDPGKLSQRLVNLMQVAIRAEIQKKPLREAIQTPETIRQKVLSQVTKDAMLSSLGIEPLALLILSIKPTPETARALEAEMREQILKQADNAVYDRRNAAVAQERRIKENELNTELAIVMKKRQISEARAETDMAAEQQQQAIREMKMTGQVKLEDKRKALMDARTENLRAEADAQAYAVEASLKPLQSLDEKVLQLLTVQSADPRTMITIAFKQLAENAEKIGQLNISPDLLDNLLKQRGSHAR